MGIFSSIADGNWAARAVREVADKLGVPISALPDYVGNAAQMSSARNRKAGQTPEQYAQVIVRTYGQQLREEIAKARGSAP